MSAITASSEVLGGIPVFTGTRVPVRTFLDYLDADKPLHEFLEDFPSVTAEQAHAVLSTVNNQF